MAWTIKETVNGYHIKEETGLTLPDSDGASEASVNTSSWSDVDPSGKKFVALVDITEAAGADGNLEIRLQGSTDDSTWATLSTTSGFDLDTSGTNTGATVIDASSDEQAPYYRLQLFTDGTDTLNSATLDVQIAIKE